MADLVKFRVVRCPKCESLLPERADYPMYQCGGCGAVLRAKKRNREAVSFSEKPVEERVERVSAELGNASMRIDHEELIPLVRKSRGSQRSETISSMADLVTVFHRLVRCPKCRKVLIGIAGISRYRCGGCGTHLQAKKRNREAVSFSEKPVEESVEKASGELGNASMRTEYEELKPEVRNSRGSQMSETISEHWRFGKRGHMKGSQRNPETHVEGVRFLNSNYSDEAPSKYFSDSSYSYGDSQKNSYPLDGSNRDEYLGQDQAELLRKIDELKDQLSRNVVEKPKEKAPREKRVVHQESFGGSDTWFRNGSSGSNRGLMQSFVPDKHVTRPPYYSHYPEPHPFMSRHEMAEHCVYPSMHTSNHILGYRDHVRTQMLRRSPNQAPDKKGISEVDTLSEKSDEERVGGFSIKLDSFSKKGMSENSENLFEKGVVTLSDASEMDVKPNSSSSTNDERISDLQIEESGEGEMEGFRRKLKIDTPESVGFSTASSPDGGPSYYDSDTSYGESLKNRSDHESNRDEYLEQDRAEILRKLDELNDQLSRMNGARKEKPKQTTLSDASEMDVKSNSSSSTNEERISDLQIDENGEGEMEGFWGKLKIDTRSVGFSTANSSDEGRSYYDSETSYGESLKNRSDHESNRDEYLEQDRAEILRKLAELKDQLSRMNGGRKEKPKQLKTGFYSTLFRVGSWRKL